MATGVPLSRITSTLSIRYCSWRRDAGAACARTGPAKSSSAAYTPRPAIAAPDIRAPRRKKARRFIAADRLESIHPRLRVTREATLGGVGGGQNPRWSEKCQMPAASRTDRREAGCGRSAYRSRAARALPAFGEGPRGSRTPAAPGPPRGFGFGPRVCRQGSRRHRPSCSGGRVVLPNGRGSTDPEYARSHAAVQATAVAAILVRAPASLVMLTAVKWIAKRRPAAGPAGRRATSRLADDPE